MCLILGTTNHVTVVTQFQFRNLEGLLINFDSPTDTGLGSQLERLRYQLLPEAGVLHQITIQSQRHTTTLPPCLIRALSAFPPNHAAA